MIGHATKDSEMSPKWRVHRVCCRLANLSWPGARWGLLPAREILHAGAHRLREIKFPLLAQSTSSGLAGVGGRR